MSLTQSITLRQLMKSFPRQIGITWTMVLLENVCMALVPLFMGYAIDDLLSGKVHKLFVLAAVLASWTLLATVRRLYDTRVYGTMRVELGKAVDERHPQLAVSKKNARLEMSRELVDFLEEQVPELLTSGVQVVVTLIVLCSFDYRLAGSAVLLTLGMTVVYALFHKRFYRFNAGLNGQMERQVTILEYRNPVRLVRHLRALRNWEVRLSDAEAFLYGLIFLMVTGFVVYNLWLCAQLEGMTTGRIFSVVSYSWEYVEAAVALPGAMLLVSRLSEITARIKEG